MEGQKKKEAKPIKVEGKKEWKVKRILNKRKVRDTKKYLVRWKGFMAEHDTWEKEEDLVNTRELVDEFEGRLNVEVRQQEKIEVGKEVKGNPGVEKYRRSELLGKYMAKLLYGWDDGKFEKYLRKLEKN